jgi:serine/threonine protein kinase
MEGGNLISEGGFGCVYHPALNCSGKESNNNLFVSKIQKYNKSAANEIRISNILKNINGYKNYFALIVNNCNIDVGKINKTNRNECNLLKKKSENKFILMKLHYIEGDIFINYLVNNKNNNENINNIINNYNHLLNSLNMLIEKKIVHFDIKNENILFNIKNKMPIIIDFGISINVNSFKYKSLKDFFYIYAPQYYVWPLEVHYLCYILNENNEPETNELYHIVNSFVDNIHVLKMFSPKFIENFKKICVYQLIKYNNISYKKRISLILDFWKTWDNYSLSIVYLKYIQYIFGSTFYENDFVVFFSKLLLKNIHPNPSKRYTIFDTIQKFNKFLNNINFSKLLMYTDIISIFSLNKNEKILKSNNIKKNLTKKIYSEYND